MDFNSTFVNNLFTSFSGEFSGFESDDYKCYLNTCDLYSIEDCTDRTLSIVVNFSKNNTDQISTGNLLLESMINFDSSVTDPKLFVQDMSNTLITSTPIRHSSVNSTFHNLQNLDHSNLDLQQEVIDLKQMVESIIKTIHSNKQNQSLPLSKTINSSTQTASVSTETEEQEKTLKTQQTSMHIEYRSTNPLDLMIKRFDPPPYNVVDYQPKPKPPKPELTKTEFGPTHFSNNNAKDKNGFVYNFIYEGNKVVITLYSSSATLHIQGKGCGNWFKEEFSILGKQLHNEVTYFQTSLIENNTDQMSTGNLLLESMINFDSSVTDPKLFVQDMSNTLITSTPIRHSSVNSTFHNLQNLDHSNLDLQQEVIDLKQMVESIIKTILSNKQNQSLPLSKTINSSTQTVSVSTQTEEQEKTLKTRQTSMHIEYRTVSTQIYKPIGSDDKTF
ncbi:unnamed protein product [Mytilus coruscus]|uniref:Uncharacterized protein n=1 Tax=Mytilus coruscus TaxID=42192 RepID=A0A6J8EY19_MYTCO|nr:unnamed protein product [Mytilus coruscus]